MVSLVRTDKATQSGMTTLATLTSEVCVHVQKYWSTKNATLFPQHALAGFYRSVHTEDLFKLKIKHLENNMKVLREYSEMVRLQECQLIIWLFD